MFGRVRCCRLSAVEGDRAAEVGDPRRQHVGDAAAVAEPDDSDLAGALRAGLEHGRGGHEVLARLRLIQLGKQLAGLVLVAGIAAERGQRVGRERDEVLERQPPGDVLDVRVQSAILVHDEDAGQLVLAVGRLGEVAAHLAVALRRVVLEDLGLEPLVVGRDLLRGDEVRVERVEQHRRGDAADGELLGLVEKAAAIDGAVDVGVEQNEQIRVEIAGRLAFHRYPPPKWEEHISAEG